MLLFTLPLVSGVCCLLFCVGIQRLPPRGIILNVSQWSVLAHNSGPIPYEARICFSTWCPQIMWSLGWLYEEDVVYNVFSGLQPPHFQTSWSLPFLCILMYIFKGTWFK